MGSWRAQPKQFPGFAANVSVLHQRFAHEDRLRPARFYPLHVAPRMNSTLRNEKPPPGRLMAK